MRGRRELNTFKWGPMNQMWVNGFEYDEYIIELMMKWMNQCVNELIEFNRNE